MTTPSLRAALSYHWTRLTKKYKLLYYAAHHRVTSFYDTHRMKLKGAAFLGIAMWVSYGVSKPTVIYNINAPRPYNPADFHAKTEAHRIEPDTSMDILDNVTVTDDASVHSIGTNRYNSNGVPIGRKHLRVYKQGGKEINEYKGDHCTDSGMKSRFTAWRKEQTNAIIARVAPIAQQFQAKTGRPASITIAQMLLESAHGLSSLAVEYNNYFGNKWVPRHKGLQGIADTFVIRNDDTPKDRFVVYESLWWGVYHHVQLVLSYKRHGSGHEAWLQSLCGCNTQGKYVGGKRYATACKKGTYIGKLKSMIDTYDLDRFDLDTTPKPVQALPKQDTVKPKKAKKEPYKMVKIPDATLHFKPRYVN